jgi:hypothetical protein
MWLAGVIDKGGNIRIKSRELRVKSADIDLIREVISVAERHADLSWVGGFGGVTSKTRKPHLVYSGHGSVMWAVTFTGGAALKVLNLVYPHLHPLKKAKADLLLGAET